jgi:outer membrane protein insertion porin family
MKVFSFYPVLVVCLVSLCWRSLEAQEGFALTKIQFVGNAAFSSDALRKQLEMYTVNRFQRIILRKKPFAFSADALSNGIERLRRFYQSEGFLQAKIADPAMKVDHKRQRLELTLQIHEGEPVHVAKVLTVLSADSSNHRMALQAVAQHQLRELILQPGMRFRDEDLRTDQGTFGKHYMNAGYPYVKVDFVLDVDQTHNRVDILWQVDPGPPCRFGAAQVTGVKESLAQLVQHHLEFRKGETFNQERIEKSQERIYGLSIFRVATLQALLGGADSTTIPIRVQVKEAPRIKAEFGIGYGTEDHFRAMIDFQVLQFPSGARRLNLLAKHSRLEPYNLSLANTNNSFLARNTSLITSIFFRRQDEEGFDVERRGGSLTVGRRFGFYTNGYVAYNLETVDDKQAENNETGAADEPTNYNKSAIVSGVKLDNSTPIFTPKRGTYASLLVMVSGFGFNSLNFYKAVLEGRRYYGITRDWVLAVRGKIGVAAPYQNDTFVPSEERFYAGGSTSIRGWGRSELGPIDPVTGDPAGGNSLLEISTEWRYPLEGILSGVFFVEAGNVWTESFKYDFGELHYAAGFGLRFRTPIGPVRFDIARPVFEAKKDVQYFLDVGHAF